jgi:hypothetical protein
MHWQGRPLLRFCNGAGDEGLSSERAFDSEMQAGGSVEGGSIKTGELGLRVTSKPRFARRLSKRFTTLGWLR